MREHEVSRVSQLTLRTNQFNLTTTRLQPADVQALVADPAAQVLTIHSGDRFGDNGLVGAIFLRRTAGTVHIDNFLLSCRVFSRGIEQACLTAILRRAKAAGIAVVQGVYRPTAKNAGVRDFYPRHGFQDTADDGQFTFRHDLAEISPLPDHVELTTSFEGEPL
jgi:FkbH-like protein